MAVRTLNGSAIQAALRSASSTGPPGNGMASRRSFSRSTALLNFLLEVLASYHFQGRQAWNLFRHASMLRLQHELQRMRRDLSTITSTKTGKRASQKLRFPTARTVKGAKDHARWRHQSNVRCTNSSGTFPMIHNFEAL